MQDWTWQCSGCRKRIEPYESHDIAECYRLHGIKMPEDKDNPLSISLFFIAAIAALWWLHG